MSENGTLKYQTTCRICGKPVAQGPLMDIPIIGEPPGARVQKFMEALGKHLQSAHKEHFQQVQHGMNAIAQFIGSTIFDIQDPNIQIYQEILRQQLRIATRRPVVPENAQQSIDAMGLDKATATRAAVRCREVTDLMLSADRVIIEEIQALNLDEQQTMQLRAILIQLRQYHCDTKPQIEQPSPANQ